MKHFQLLSGPVAPSEADVRKCDEEDVHGEVSCKGLPAG